MYAGLNNAVLERLCFSIAKYRLDRLGNRVLFSADELRLVGERCWKVGLILSELLTNVARHARFDDRRPEAQMKLAPVGSVVKYSVSDNGSTPELILRGRGLTIIADWPQAWNSLFSAPVQEILRSPEAIFHRLGPGK